MCSRGCQLYIGVRRDEMVLSISSESWSVVLYSKYEFLYLDADLLIVYPRNVESYNDELELCCAVRLMVFM